MPDQPLSSQSEREVEIVVHVRVNVDCDMKAHALEMVKDALANRPSYWQSTTFVSEGDVHVR